MKCNGKTSGWADGELHPCENGASIQRGDKNYCWSHDPEGQAKRDAAQEKKTTNPR